MSQVSNITLSVPDVSCDHCVAAINKVLGDKQGVSSVQVDLSTKTVNLSYDEAQMPLNTIEQILDDAGYPVAK
jgi:copper chaperone